MPAPDRVRPAATFPPSALRCESWRGSGEGGTGNANYRVIGSVKIAVFKLFFVQFGLQLLFSNIFKRLPQRLFSRGHFRVHGGGHGVNFLG